MDDTDVAVIGAGPHGLAAAAHLGRAAVECHVIGEPMSFWRGMPEHMLLRSNRTATSIAEHRGPLSLESYCRATNRPLTMPFPLEDFLSYGSWVAAQVAPDVDQRRVKRVSRDDDSFRLEFTDGDQFRARRVVVAAGIAGFAHRPQVGADLTTDLATHSSEHTSFTPLRGRKVLVVGGGQSALESAALLHEAGSNVTVAMRGSGITWLHGGKYHRLLGRYARLVYAPTDVGPMGISRIVGAPELFRRLPHAVQNPMAKRAIRPAGARWLMDRLADVPIHTHRVLTAARPSGSGVQVDSSQWPLEHFDHVIFGTGYRVDIARYDFLDDDLLSHIRQVNGYPVLGRGMESSVPGLHFMGAPAAHSWGPVMRFVAGGWFGAEALVASLGTDHKETSRHRPMTTVDDGAV